MLTIRVICPECGHRFSAGTDRSRARCPDCDEIFYLPDDKEAIQKRPRRDFRDDDDHVRRPARDDYRARDDRRDRDEDDEDVPRRKKKKRKKKRNQWVVPLILGLVGVAACVALVVVVVILMGKLGGSGNSAGHEYESAQGEYKATFPRAPLEKSEVAMGIAVKMAYVEDRNGVCVTGFADMPIPGNEPWVKIEDRLRGSQMGMLRNAGGHATKTDIQRGPPPHIEFEGAVSRPANGKVRAKVYLHGKRLYQVFVMGTADYVDGRDATRFLDSFQITKK